MPRSSSSPRPTNRDDDGQRLYVLLALFDTRDGTPIADLVRSAREGWERSHPNMGEDNAWQEFDRLWDRSSSSERLSLARGIFAVRNDLCSCCGRYHDHTGRPVLAMIDWKGKRWAVTPGTRPTPNGDDLGGREYGRCVHGRAA